MTTEAGHANVLGDVGWVDFREPPDDWLAHDRQRGGLMSVNHPIARPRQLDCTPMHGRPPLVEVWHWSWLDLHWTTPLAWWLAWDPGAIPVGGSDWHRPGLGRPAGITDDVGRVRGTGPGAVLDGLRAGRVAISAGRDGPVLLRRDGELVAVDADGTMLTGPDGPAPGSAARWRLSRARPAATGCATRPGRPSP